MAVTHASHSQGCGVGWCVLCSNRTPVGVATLRVVAGTIGGNLESSGGGVGAPPLFYCPHDAGGGSRVLDVAIPIALHSLGSVLYVYGWQCV